MKNAIGNEYFELVRKFLLQQISNDKALHEATPVMDELTSRENRSSYADSYLDVLSDLVEKYERQHRPIPDAAPVELLRVLIADRQTTRVRSRSTGRILTSTMSEILNGRRRLNLQHMRKLSSYFGVFGPRHPLQGLLRPWRIINLMTIARRILEKRAAPKRATTPKWIRRMRAYLLTRSQLGQRATAYGPLTDSIVNLWEAGEDAYGA